jgi:S1-C subfamily serine protease
LPPFAARHLRSLWDARAERGKPMTVAAKALGLGCTALAIALTPTSGRAQSDRADLKAFAVHVNRTPQQPWPGYGVYLGNGLILTAAHVAGNVEETKPHVLIAGRDLPAALVKQGNLESVDLTLLSIDGTKLPIGLQMRRTPLCKRPPYAGEKVIVAIPEGTAPSRVLAPQAIPANLRGRFDTNIADVATTGNSGSGVFDANDLCLLGIMSRKISITQLPLKIGAQARTTDIAKYFVPSAAIEAFIPQGVSF